MRLLLALSLVVSLSAEAMPPLPRPPPFIPPCPPPGVLKSEWRSGFLTYWCEPPPGQGGIVQPKFHVTHVVYAVPGKSSSLTYASGDAVGSTTSLTDSNKQGVSTTIGASGLLGIGANFTYSYGADWGGSNARSTDVSVTQNTSYRKPGQENEVEHLDDEIWFVVKPILDVTVWQQYQSRPFSSQWKFRQGQQLVAYYMTVGELRGIYPIEAGVQAALNQWGITAADYPELLKANPFAYDDEPQPNRPMDVARFELLATLPYVPVSQAGHAPASQTFEIVRRVQNTSTLGTEVSYNTSIELGGGVNFTDIARATWKLTEKWSWTHSTSSRLSRESTTRNSVTVGQPAFGYKGPTVLRVYEDKIWKTLVTQLDWY